MTHPIAFRKPLPHTQPSYHHPPYGSTLLRAPRHPPIDLPSTPTELTGPEFGPDSVPTIFDLTRGHRGEPIGERIFVAGRVIDENAKPVARALIEIWQCNAAGRYLHAGDRHDAPLDPNFNGVGRVLTDAEGRYRFCTIRPGPYPWQNHYNAWRPAHIHFSLFGPAWATRLVTQMYFPGDPLLDLDPIYQSIPDAAARARLIAALDWEYAVAGHALGYRFDIVLRGRLETPREKGA